MVPIIFRGLCGYVWVYGLTYSLYHSILHKTLTITEPEHCIGGGSSVVQYLKACLERAHVSILTSLQRKNNQVLVLFWFGCAYRTRFNVTCDAATALILFTQSFKVVSVEVRVLFIYFFNWVTNLSDE